MDLTWTCNICKEERPDHMIAVHTTEKMYPGGVRLFVNTRYCVDKPDCINAAPHYSHFRES